MKIIFQIDGGRNEATLGGKDQQQKVGKLTRSQFCFQQLGVVSTVGRSLRLRPCGCQSPIGGYEQKLDYIHENPVRAGWVEQPEDYLYSSAKSLLLNVPGRLPLADWYS